MTKRVRIDDADGIEGNPLNDDRDNENIWGVPAMARYIGRTPRQVYHLIAKGRLPVKKLGRRTIVARKRELDAALSAKE